jgi:hypothetical protein
MKYSFVATFESDCCAKPHLWIESVDAPSESAAKKKFLRIVRADGRQVFEVARLAGHAHGPVTTVND